MKIESLLKKPRHHPSAISYNVAAAWPIAIPGAWLPAFATPLRRGELYSVAHGSEDHPLPITWQMSDAGNPASLIIEARSVGIAESLPAIYDAIPPTLQKISRRQLIPLARIDGGRSRHEVPEIIVVPQRKRNDVGHREAPLGAGTAPRASRHAQPLRRLVSFDNLPARGR